ncbi:MAG TPA: hypothetical protein PLA85_07610 [Micropepsaceae bacterium]|nr:hypothetical protein [Micropepsaceae bacterium]
MPRLIALIVAFAALCAAPVTRAAGTAEPRTIIGIWNSHEDDAYRLSNVHALAEMPLNHLGLLVEPYDIFAGLPDLSARNDVRGILIWVTDDRLSEEGAEAFAAWLETARARKLPIVIFGAVPGDSREDETPGDPAVLARIFGALGLVNLGGWLSYSYDLSITQIERDMLEFERKLDDALPAVEVVRAAPGVADVRPLITLVRRNDPASLTTPAVITPFGAYVQSEFIIWGGNDGTFRMWRLNPFRFFRDVFGTGDLPKPDTTTLTGRRIYYSHIDGDGWVNISNADGYRDRGIISAEVILNEIIAAYPDLPVTVAPIAAEIDPAFGAREDAIAMARRILALPQVEAASHTYSHPYQWDFFGPAYDVARDLAFVNQYPKVRIDPAASGIAAAERSALSGNYELPRAYGDIPYSLEREISGSLALVNALAPEGRAGRLIQWSGDTSPGEEVLRLVRERGFLNINGGDTRFDGDWPSYTAVSPVGRQVGAERQIYSSQANENLYTDLWRGRFFGFRFLETSLRNTESPIRVKPINIYYHMYSGEREEGLSALRRNLDYARGEAITPVTTSHYAEIGNGFYTARVIREGDGWAIEDRGALNTIRFDDAVELLPDLARSSGVMGAVHFQGSLYVALDPVAERPVIVLTRGDPGLPMLVESRWPARGMAVSAARVTFAANGFGAGDMIFQVDPNSAWMVSANGQELMRATATDEGELAFSLPAAMAMGDVQVMLVREGGG